MFFTLFVVVVAMIVNTLFVGAVSVKMVNVVRKLAEASKNDFVVDVVYTLSCKFVI